MKMIAKNLMGCLEELTENIENISKLKNTPEWDLKDKLDDAANVNKPFNLICDNTLGQLLLLKTILTDSLNSAEVSIGE